MKKYTFLIVVEEGNDDFWGEIAAKGVTGCEEVTSAIDRALSSSGFLVGPDEDTRLKLISFENR